MTSSTCTSLILCRWRSTNPPNVICNIQNYWLKTIRGSSMSPSAEWQECGGYTKRGQKRYRGETRLGEKREVKQNLKDGTEERKRKVAVRRKGIWCRETETQANLQVEDERRARGDEISSVGVQRRVGVGEGGQTDREWEDQRVLNLRWALFDELSVSPLSLSDDSRTHRNPHSSPQLPIPVGAFFSSSFLKTLYGLGSFKWWKVQSSAFFWGIQRQFLPRSYRSFIFSLSYYLISAASPWEILLGRINCLQWTVEWLCVE